MIFGRRQCVWALGFALLLVATVPALAQQEEGSRHLTGEFITGYSSFDVNNNAVRGPYAGFDADLQGYWKHPQVLTYDFKPNLSSGFEYAGPMSGPEGRGVSADTTFLGGSDFPVSLFFSRQSIPTPDLVQNASDTILGTSRVNQNYGVDWRIGLRRLPTVTIHYSDNSSDMQYPESLGGNSNYNQGDFRVTMNYVLAKWHLNSEFTNTNSHAQDILTNIGTSQEDRFHNRDLMFTGSRDLPFRSHVQLEADKHQSDLYVGDNGSTSNYTRGAGSISSLITSRLTSTFNMSYVTSYADLARQQVLQPGPSTPPATALANLDLGMMMYGGSLNYRILDSLSAHGNFNATKLTSDSDTAEGSGHAVGGGLSFYHMLFQGQFTAGYDYTVNTTKTGLVDYDSNTQSFQVGYGHALPWGIRFGSNAMVQLQDLNGLVNDNLSSYVVGLDLSRHVGNGWDIRGRVDLNRLAHDYPARAETQYQAFQLQATSKRIQIGILERFDNGLAYRFGNGVILVPNAPSYPTLNGLPAFVETVGRSTTINAAFRASRHLSLRGGYGRSNRTVDSGNAIAQNLYDFHAEYGFRKVRAAAGYTKNSQLIEGFSAADFFDRRFYVELKRDFHFF